MDADVPQNTSSPIQWQVPISFCLAFNIIKYLAFSSIPKLLYNSYHNRSVLLTFIICVFTADHRSIDMPSPKRLHLLLWLPGIVVSVREPVAQGRRGTAWIRGHRGQGLR